MRNIPEGRDQFANSGTDFAIFQEIQRLRQAIEDKASWDALRKKAVQEIDGINPYLVNNLITAYAPYLLELPASHSVGHVAHDTIHLTDILYSLSEEDGGELSEAEIIAGIIGGKFHDCAVALVKRYEDPLHFASHADVGAWMLGQIGKDIIPPHLLQMAQFAIAAHTNYQSEFHVTRDDRTVTKVPFYTEGKPSVSLTRGSDRGDITGIPIIWRHLLGVLAGGYITTQRGFEYHEPDDGQLIMQYNLEKGSHMRLFKEYVSSANSGNPYTRDDIPSLISNFLLPNAQLLDHFNQSVINRTETNSYDKQVKQFLRICRLHEPGIDINIKINRLRHILFSLPDELKNAWGCGFQILAENLIPQAHARALNKFTTEPVWIMNKHPKVQEIVHLLKSKALTLLEANHPRYLSLEQYDDEELPSIADILLAS